MAASEPKRRKLPLLVRGRLWVQAAFLLVWLDPLALRLHLICGPVLHCYSCPLATFACPIGVLAGFTSLQLFPFLAVGTMLLAAAAVGGFVCGWVCPFGFLQDLVGKVPTPKFRLPAWTSHMRYAVLVGLVLLVPFFLGEEHFLYICRVCPAGALEGAAPNMVKTAIAGGTVVWPSALKLTIVGLFLVAMFFTHRPWCSLFCPLGAIYGLGNRVSAFFLRVKPNECTACGLCAKQCRYGVDPQHRANDPRCIRCLECTSCTALSVGSIFSRRR